MILQIEDAGGMEDGPMFLGPGEIVGEMELCVGQRAHCDSTLRRFTVSLVGDW